MEFIIANSTELLLLLFLIITFLQSGWDKLTDWTGNLAWLKGHFEKTPLKNSVPLLLGVVLILEILAAILCTISVVQILGTGKSSFAMYGAAVSCIVLLMLLFGQRVAKDYDGARTIAIYFIPAIFLVYLLQA
ncbi:DoxX family protein [Maribacter polysaccharolyticus]|uniref:DoxX family protein n=1 Tax=Maribacter polysaccharolyticus TaxID=3020831 RepID=UPI00237F5607|nr:DoxX family protein [Maribacter polysaccharolyticus]MDE3742196.1 DoxX family protein [Maribacter polysaccharolyticus]